MDAAWRAASKLTWIADVSKITLHPHQDTVNSECRQKFIEGKKSVLIQAATGFGKSICGAYQIYNSQLRGKISIFVVPRKQLIDQMADTFDKFGIEYSYIASGYPYNEFAQTFICSQQTLVKRLDLVKPDVCFWDEVHIGGAGLDKCITHYSSAYHIGLSASPKRLDGRGLGCWFEAMVQGPSVEWLIENSYLSDYRIFAPTTYDPGFGKRGGDYKKEEVNDYMMAKPQIIGDAVSSYRNYANGKLMVCFCPSIEHSKMTAASFTAAGIPAAHMDGETPKDERKRIIRAFARREILILCNVEICTTGFDLSSASGMDVTVEGIIDLRHTASLALQLQKWGRALRRKDYPAVILDHVGNVARHGLPDDEREWSLADEKKKKREITEREAGLAICPTCFCHHRPTPVCPNCGHVYEVKSRAVEQVEGELVEVDKVALRKQRRREEGQCVSLEDFIALGKQRGYKPGWAYRRYAMRKSQKSG